MIALAVAAAAAFNLVCSGTTTTAFQGTPSKAPTAYSATFRIDLAAQRWCGGVCTETHVIPAVSPTEITLENFSNANGEGHQTISRESGRYSLFLRINNFANSQLPMIVTTEAQCATAPFSGFPTPKF